MNRRNFCAVVAMAVLGLALGSWPRSARAAPLPSKPNIIFILSDDVGLGNIGCYGADNFKTPNIDALAASGIRFQRCYSTPLCGPSRGQILTGRYPFRTGMTGNAMGHVLKPANEIMIPRVLKPAGYVTAQVGKWSQLPLTAGDWGFDEYLQFPNSGRYWREQTPNYTLNGEKKELPEGVYLPDLMHDFLVDFINRHKSEPFYVHYAMSHIHGPILRTPDSAPGSKDLYADNVAYMDKLVGKLVAELDRLKLRDKTLIIFVGDNGTARFGVESSTIGGKHVSGQKATMLEGGSRVPMIASFPGVVPAGKVLDDLIDFSDFFPTFTELAGGTLPQGVTIDGRSFASRLSAEGKPVRQWIYVELNGNRYIRNDGWKLSGAGELYDMKNAPFEEPAVAPGTSDPAAQAARKELQAAMVKLVGVSPSDAATKPAAAKTTRAQRRAKRKAKAPIGS